MQTIYIRTMSMAVNKITPRSRFQACLPVAEVFLKETGPSSAGGESAFLAFDPDDPRYVYGGSYLGTIDVTDMESRTSTNIMAAPIQYLGRAARDMKYLFNWNAPIIWSQHEPGTIYHGAQMLLRSKDMGETWEGDFTRSHTKY